MKRPQTGKRAPTIPISLDKGAAWLSLVVALTWPGDEAKRREAIATFGTAAIAKDGRREAARDEAGREVDEAVRPHGLTLDGFLKEPGGQGFFDAIEEELFVGIRDTLERDMIDPSGGFETVARAPGLETIRGQIEHAIRREGHLVGTVLCFIAQIALFHPEVGASLNCALAMMRAERGTRDFWMKADRGDFYRRVWKPWRGIAPLHAAHLIALQIRRLEHPTEPARAERPWTADEVAEIVGWAKWFRRWAVSFVPPRSGQVLIKATEAYDYDCLVPEIEPPLAALNPARLAIAKTAIRD